MISLVTEAGSFWEKGHSVRCRPAITHCNPLGMQSWEEERQSLLLLLVRCGEQSTCCAHVHTCLEMIFPLGTCVRSRRFLCWAPHLIPTRQERALPLWSGRERVFLIQVEEQAASVLLQNHASNTSRLLKLTVRKSIYNDFAIVLLLMCRIWFSSAGFERFLWGRRR